MIRETVITQSFFIFPVGSIIFFNPEDSTESVPPFEAYILILRAKIEFSG